MDSAFHNQRLGRRALLLAPLSFAACMFTGCTYAEGPVSYTVRGTLVDALSGQPVQGARVAASASEREDLNGLAKWAPSNRSADDGTFEGTFTVSGRNRHYLFGFIPLEPSRPPHPPPLSNVYLYVLREPNRALVPAKTDETKHQRTEPGHRWIDLGKVGVSLQEP